jgi:hypothetical protein
MYKDWIGRIVNGLEKVNFVKKLNLGPNRRPEGRNYNLRSNNRALEREIVRNCNPRHNFLTNRVTIWWNKLPNDIVNAPNLNVFKAGIDRWLARNAPKAATAQ